MIRKVISKKGNHYCPKCNRKLTIIEEKCPYCQQKLNWKIDTDWHVKEANNDNN